MNRNVTKIVSLLILTAAMESLSTHSLLAQTEGAAPTSSQALLEQAIQKAKTENKNILVHFGASW